MKRDPELLSLQRLLRPVKPRASYVSTPGPLPSLLSYGPQERGVAQSSRYTGGVSQAPAHLVQNQTLDFTEPTYAAPTLPAQASSHATSALAAAFAPRSNISGPTPPPPPPGSYGPASRAFIEQYGQAPSVYLPQQTSIHSSSPGSIQGPGAPAPVAQVTPPSSVSAANLARGKRGVYGV